MFFQFIAYGVYLFTNILLKGFLALSSVTPWMYGGKVFWLIGPSFLTRDIMPSVPFVQVKVHVWLSVAAYITWNPDDPAVITLPCT